MSTKKDGTINENIDRNKSAQEDWESHHTGADRYPEDAKGIAETDVKNAHAAGDGAYGRNDTGLHSSNPDTGEEKEDEPPY